MRRRGSFDIEDMPERVDTGIGGSDNTQVLSTTLTLRWKCVGAKCNPDYSVLLYFCQSRYLYCNPDSYWKDVTRAHHVTET